MSVHVLVGFIRLAHLKVLMSWLELVGLQHLRLRCLLLWSLWRKRRGHGSHVRVIVGVGRFEVAAVELSVSHKELLSVLLVVDDLNVVVRDHVLLEEL